MNHCETCKHWKVPKKHFYKTLGLCLSEKIIYLEDAEKYGTQEEFSKFFADKLAYWDDRDLSASALVGPRFGCIYHETKEQK